MRNNLLSRIAACLLIFMGAVLMAACAIMLLLMNLRGFPAEMPMFEQRAVAIATSTLIYLLGLRLLGIGLEAWKKS